MVVRVFKARLQGVVVDICDGKLRPYALNAHSFEFKIGHRARSVLRKSLVDSQSDLAAYGHFARYKMAFNQLLCNCKSHKFSP